jgi:NADP-dependent 3-hydroxy acid dehydrogenase YdfG
VAQLGRVDLHANNAGYYQIGPLEATTMDQVHRQFQTNAFGLIAMTKAFIPTFRAESTDRIINIASITGDQGYPYNSVPRTAATWTSTPTTLSISSSTESIETR